MKRLGLALALSMMAFAPIVHAQAPAAGGNEIAALRKIDHDWLAAEKRYDVPYCQKFFADSYVLVLPNGEMYDKKKWLGILASPKERPTLQVLDPQDIQVHIDGNVAIVTDHTTIKGHDSTGASMDGQFRVFRVLIKQNGSWKATGVVMNQIH